MGSLCYIACKCHFGYFVNPFQWWSMRKAKTSCSSTALTSQKYCSRMTDTRKQDLCSLQIWNQFLNTDLKVSHIYNMQFCQKLRNWAKKVLAYANACSLFLYLWWKRLARIVFQIAAHFQNYALENLNK